MSVCDIPEFKSPSVNIERKINFIFSIFLVEASYLVAYNVLQPGDRPDTLNKSFHQS